MAALKTIILIIICSFASSVSAQTCILYTQQGDTVAGIVEFKHLKGNTFKLAIAGIDRIDLQHGIRVTKKDKSKQFYKPSELKEAWVFPTVFDTLRLIAFAKKDLFPAFVMETVTDTTADSHVLVESSLYKGALIWCRYYLQTEEKTNYGYDKVTKLNTFDTYKTQTYTELVSLRGKWNELPEERNYKNDLLITLLKDCPELVGKLQKNKINVAKKMSKVVAYYNHCQNQ